MIDCWTMSCDWFICHLIGCLSRTRVSDPSEHSTTPTASSDTAVVGGRTGRTKSYRVPPAPITTPAVRLMFGCVYCRLSESSFYCDFSYFVYINYRFLADRLTGTLNLVILNIFWFVFTILNFWKKKLVKCPLFRQNYKCIFLYLIFNWGGFGISQSQWIHELTRIHDDQQKMWMWCLINVFVMREKG